MLSDSFLGTLAIIAIPVLLAITLHEAAHGYVAYRLGDNTAKRMGRISINPLRHIDPLGTLILPAVMYFTTGFMFGWAKPVPVDMRQFKQPVLDMGLVAVAGPVSNFFMACGWAGLIALAERITEGNTAQVLVTMAQFGILINVILLVLNLIPIPPLDGGRVLTAILPRDLGAAFMRIEPYGMWILIALLFTGVLGKFLWPVVQQFQAIIGLIFGI